MKKNKTAGITAVSVVFYVAVGIFIISVLYQAWSLAQVRTQDSRRMRDIAEVHKALELYFDHHEDYPVVASKPISSTEPEWDILLTKLSPYLTGKPIDPVNNSGFPWSKKGYSYVYITGEKDSNGIRTYDLIAKLADTSNPHTCSSSHWLIHSLPGQHEWCEKDLKIPLTDTISIGPEPMLYSDH